MTARAPPLRHVYGAHTRDGPYHILVGARPCWRGADLEALVRARGALLAVRPSNRSCGPTAMPILPPAIPHAPTSLPSARAPAGHRGTRRCIAAARARGRAHLQRHGRTSGWGTRNRGRRGTWSGSGTELCVSRLPPVSFTELYRHGAPIEKYRYSLDQYRRPAP